MSDTSDVKIIALNTKTQFTTSAAIDRVKIHNNSSMYLRVYFGSDAPLNPTDFGWHDTIGPGASPLIWIVGASASAFSDRTNYLQSTPYLGVITVMPFLPVGSFVSAGGVLSGASFCFVTGYYSQERAEQGGQIEAFVQAAKQGRYQEAGPGAVTTFVTAFDQTTVGGPTNLLEFIGGVNAPLFKANQAAASVINIYLFAWGGYFRNLGPNAATVAFEPTFACTSSGGGVTRASNIVFTPHCARTVNYGTDNWAYIYSNPLLCQLSLTQGVMASNDEIRMGLQYFGAINQGIYDGAFWIAFLVDKVNQTPLLSFTGGPVVGTVTNFPWNASYNPQTY